MRIFVVNAYPERKEKYLSDKRYELFPAVWWENVSEEEVDKYHFRHNAKLEYRKKVVACSLSHKKILLKIIQEKLENIIIIEDDALIDFERLDELRNINEFIYIGGDVTSPLLKNMKYFKENDKQELQNLFMKGINEIDPEIFKIGQTAGYFVPNFKVAQAILSNIPHGKKERAIDTEFIYLQKKKIINKFLFPAISVLYLEDAKNGFTYSNYKLYDNQKFY